MMMECDDEFDPVFESMQKSARRHRTGKWGLRTSRSLAWHPVAQSNFHKREHNVIAVFDRQSEVEARPAEGEPGSVYYRYFYQGSFERPNRRHGVKAMSVPNPNQAAPLSTVPLSLDKDKRWEVVSEAKKKNADNKVAVFERSLGPYRMEYRIYTEMQQYGLVNGFVNQSLRNKPLDELDEDGVPLRRYRRDGRYRSMAPKFRVTRNGRKGFTVRQGRTPGKRGVKQSTHHNSFSSEIYDINEADTLVIAANAPKMTDYANTHISHGGCRCSMCRDPRPNAHHRDKAHFKKSIIQDL